MGILCSPPKPSDHKMKGGEGSWQHAPGLGAGGSLTSTGVWLPMATWVRAAKTTPQLSEPSCLLSLQQSKREERIVAKTISEQSGHCRGQGTPHQ